MRIEKVLTPADSKINGSELNIWKDNLSPQQFTPVTVLLDIGNYRVLHHTWQAIWAVVSGVIGFALGKLQ